MKGGTLGMKKFLLSLPIIFLISSVSFADEIVDVLRNKHSIIYVIVEKTSHGQYHTIWVNTLEDKITWKDVVPMKDGSLMLILQNGKYAYPYKANDKGFYCIGPLPKDAAPGIKKQITLNTLLGTLLSNIQTEKYEKKTKEEVSR